MNAQLEDVSLSVWWASIDGFDLKKITDRSECLLTKIGPSFEQYIKEISKETMKMMKNDCSICVPISKLSHRTRLRDERKYSKPEKVDCRELWSRCTILNAIVAKSCPTAEPKSLKIAKKKSNSIKCYNFLFTRFSFYRPDIIIIIFRSPLNVSYIDWEKNT